MCVCVRERERERKREKERERDKTNFPLFLFSWLGQTNMLKLMKGASQLILEKEKI